VTSREENKTIQVFFLIHCGLKLLLRARLSKNMSLFCTLHPAAAHGDIRPDPPKWLHSQGEPPSVGEAFDQKTRRSLSSIVGWCSFDILVFGWFCYWRCDSYSINQQLNQQWVMLCYRLRIILCFTFSLSCCLVSFRGNPFFIRQCLINSWPFVIAFRAIKWSSLESVLIETRSWIIIIVFIYLSFCLTCDGVAPYRHGWYTQLMSISLDNPSLSTSVVFSYFYPFLYFTFLSCRAIWFSLLIIG
jgi:hypothetical protein